ncbi:MAG: DUF4175 domain-containing protein [Rhodospirillales bacterium]|nr:DUF4175 domain-containing protein [Rhodospirillales bacterium]
MRYQALLWLARGAVVWEWLWPRLWPANAVAAVFLIVAFFDLLPQLPAWVHAGFLVLLAFSFLGALVFGFRGLGVPAHETARHRIERDSGLDHRPLAALEDELAGGHDDDFARSLWQTHRARLAHQARRLHLSLPAGGLARVDPWGFRAAAILILVVGLVVGSGDVGERLARAALPDFSGGPSTPINVEVWLTPPAYTQSAPVFLDLNANGEEIISVPAGTTLLAQISGSPLLPSLKTGEQILPFEILGEASHRLETTLEPGSGMTIGTDQGPLADWPIRVTADTPPTITWAAPPDATDRGYLRLKAEAADDYGIKQIDAEIVRTDAAVKGAEPLALAFPLPSRAPKKYRLRQVRDLTAHLWAGRDVRLQLIARDVAGQSARSDAVDLVLPERAFLHPTARAIVSERKKLADPTPAIRAEVSAGLDVIGRASQHFGHDTVVFLALSLAGRRLRYDKRDQAIDAVAELLWETALRLEDGGLSIAERDLRRAEDRLMEALERGAESAEIDRLLAELQRALGQFLAELAQELTRMGMMETPIDPDGAFMDSHDLRNMIDEVRELAQSGSLEAARQRLAELKRMLQDLRAGARPGGNSKQAAEARKLMETLQRLAKRQQDLLDRTFGRQRERQPPQEKDAAAQEALRRDLGNMMLDLDALLGDIPEQLGKAERAMRQATGALGEGDTGRAIEAQSEALQHLRSGGQNTARQMARGLGLMPGFIRGSQPVLPLGSRRDRDPFGRRSDGTSGFSTDDSVKIPDKAGLRRAEHILKELRRRAGQRERPRLELDYIERLLKIF